MRLSQLLRNVRRSAVLLSRDAKLATGLSLAALAHHCAYTTQHPSYALAAPASCAAADAAALTTSESAVLAPAPRSLAAELARQVHALAVALERLLRYLSRFATITAVASPLLALAPAAYLLGDSVPEVEIAALDYLCWALGVLGPAFIKLAQWASSRPDLYSPLVIAKLSKFQDDVKVRHSTQTVDATLSDAFGAGWREHLEIDPVPIGSGCIAQVFKGIVTEGSKKIAVAVKVIHPHVEAMIKTDMEILAMLGSCIDAIPALEMLSLGESARQFGRSMMDQLDMSVEAANLTKFRKKWQNESWASFPQPIAGYESKNVLVETLMEGRSIVNYMALRDDLGESTRKLKATLSDLGARAMIKMIFFDNFIHGDMHPGNILVNIDPEGRPHLVFLDCGIVYFSKTESDHKSLVEICIAFMQHDGRRAARLMIDNAAGANKVANAEAFVESVQRIVDDSLHHSYFEHLGEYIVRICELARVHRVRLDPGYFHIAMALKVSEGISLSLDKDLDLVTKCVPVIMKARALKALGRSFSFVDDIN